VAKRLRTSRENVSIIEHRAYANVKAAKSALAAIEHLSESRELVLPSGTSVFEAVSMTLLRADMFRIKLRFSADSILAAIRSKCKKKIRGHHLTSPVRITIADDGNIRIR
jgi:Tfx family DNA-binding protein